MILYKDFKEKKKNEDKSEEEKEYCISLSILISF